MKRLGCALGIVSISVTFYWLISMGNTESDLNKQKHNELTTKCQSLGGTVIRARDLAPICVKELK